MIDQPQWLANLGEALGVPLLVLHRQFPGASRPRLGLRLLCHRQPPPTDYEATVKEYREQMEAQGHQQLN
jgi:hypothetical protein